MEERGRNDALRVVVCRCDHREGRPGDAARGAAGHPGPGAHDAAHQHAEG